MFQFPTARALATSLGIAEDADDGAVQQGKDRAQLRREAIQRQRERQAGPSRR
jgi:hypothetical protein